MKELKLRIWDKKNRQMLYAQEPEEQGKREYYPLVFLVGFSHWSTDDFSDPMLSSGLKDKTGTEVYEGDILLLTLGKHRLEVRWSLFGFRFFNLDREDWQMIYAADLKRIEIIGNIYEQPALLEKDGVS